MRSIFLFVASALCIFAPDVSAESQKTIFNGRSILYGGLGFVFNDTSNFDNPGQSALADGTTIGLTTTKTSATSYTNKPTVTKAWEKMSLGAFYSQTTSELTGGTTSANMVGGMVGSSFRRGKFTAGGSYVRTISDPTLSEFIAVTFNYNAGGNRKTGMAYGLGFASEAIGYERWHTVTIGVGKAFTENNAIELNWKMNDNRDVGNFDLGAFYVGRRSKLYWAAGFNYHTKTQPEAAARVGLILRGFDISGTINYSLSGSPTYAGTARILF